MVARRGTVLLGIANVFTKVVGPQRRLRLEVRRAERRLKDRGRSREKN
jgi:hypothetical protein